MQVSVYLQTALLRIMKGGCVCMYLYVHMSKYVCMYVCICMYVCMHVHYICQDFGPTEGRGSIQFSYYSAVHSIHLLLGA